MKDYGKKVQHEEMVTLELHSKQSLKKNHTNKNHSIKGPIISLGFFGGS